MEIRKFEKKEIDVVTERYTECDKCNQRIKQSGFDVFECRFKYKEGTVYPEGGSYSKTTMDLCQKCAVELMRTLETLGFRLNEEEVDV